MGSGTTAIACAELRRAFTGIEIEDRYFEIACSRIKSAYGETGGYVAPETLRQESVEPPTLFNYSTEANNP